MTKVKKLLPGGLLNKSIRMVVAAGQKAKGQKKLGEISKENEKLIETSKEIVIKYYGWRIPLFGMFPNIIMSKQEEVLESISSSETRVIQYNYHKEARIKEEIEEISKPLNLYHELWKKISKYD